MRIELKLEEGIQHQRAISLPVPMRIPRHSCVCCYLILKLDLRKRRRRVTVCAEPVNRAGRKPDC